MILLFLLSLLFSPTVKSSNDKQFCQVPLSTENFYSRQYGLPITALEQLQEKFQQSYSQAGRLKGRAFWDEKKNSFYFTLSNNTRVAIPTLFLNNLQSHINIALKRGYADYIYYKDMGHAHLLLPTKIINKLKENKTSNEKILTKALSSPELKFLYHTGELIQFKEGSLISGKLLDDDWMRWRYFSRNIIADNKTGQDLQIHYAKGKPYNTVRALEGYQQVSKIYFTGNEKGCFTFKQQGELRRFDATLQTPSSK